MLLSSLLSQHQGTVYRTCVIALAPAEQHREPVHALGHLCDSGTSALSSEVRDRVATQLRDSEGLDRITAAQSVMCSQSGFHCVNSFGNSNRQEGSGARGLGDSGSFLAWCLELRGERVNVCVFAVVNA